MEEFKVYPNKKKVFLYLLGSLVFVLAGLLFIYFYTFDFTNIILLIVGLPAVLFFGLCFFFYLYRLFSREPSIVLTEEGIIDNSSAIGTGLLRWNDIKEVRIYDFSINSYNTKINQKFLGIMPKDVNKFHESQGSLKKGILGINRNLTPFPINIPQNLLNITLEDLEREIKKRLELYNQ